MKPSTPATLLVFQLLKLLLVGILEFHQGMREMRDMQEYLRSSCNYWKKIEQVIYIDSID